MIPCDDYISTINHKRGTQQFRCNYDMKNSCHIELLFWVEICNSPLYVNCIGKMWMNGFMWSHYYREIIIWIGSGNSHVYIPEANIEYFPLQSKLAVTLQATPINNENNLEGNILPPMQKKVNTFKGTSTVSDTQAHRYWLQKNPRHQPIRRMIAQVVSLYLIKQWNHFRGTEEKTVLPA